MENKNMVQPEKECKTCKNSQTPEQYAKKNWLIFVFSFYLLFASVYGTIHLVKELISLFH
jgi:hypothetical protein